MDWKKVLRRGLVSRGVFFLAVGALVWGLTDQEQAFINRVNYLKNRTDTYLVEFEQGGKQAGDPELMKLAAYSFRKIAQQSKQESFFWGTAGFCEFYAGDYRRAIVSYEKALALDPQMYTFAWDLGMIYYQLRRYAEATVYLSQALDRIPLTRAFYDKLGAEKRVSQSGAKSFLRFSRMKSRLEKDEELGIHFLAQAFFEIGRFEKIKDIAVLGLRRHPKSAALVCDLGMSYFGMRHVRLAERYFTAAIALDPDYVPAYEYRQQAWDLLGKRAEAAADQERVRDIKGRGAVLPTPGPLHANLDLIFFRYQSP